MTEHEKLQLKTLIWKEWQPLQGFVYITIAFAGLGWYLSGPVGQHLGHERLIMLAIFTPILTCLGVGVMAYGLEFNDKTSAYLATRPTSHNQVFIVKVLLGLVLCLGVALFSRAYIALLLGNPLPGTQAAKWESHLNLWWLYAPTMFLSVQTVILLVRPIVPAIILSTSVGLAALYLCFNISAWQVVLAWPPLLVLSYFLSRWRLNAGEMNSRIILLILFVTILFFYIAVNPTIPKIRVDSNVQRVQKDLQTLSSIMLKNPNLLKMAEGKTFYIGYMEDLFPHLVNQPQVISEFPKDPFDPEGRGYLWATTNISDNFMIICVGPDGVLNLSAKEMESCKDDSELRDKLRWDWAYSPTNGAYSSGDIYRLQQ